jgi:hypothetical protein
MAACGGHCGSRPCLQGCQWGAGRLIGETEDNLKSGARCQAAVAAVRGIAAEMGLPKAPTKAGTASAGMGRE